MKFTHVYLVPFYWDSVDDKGKWYCGE